MNILAEAVYITVHKVKMGKVVAKNVVERKPGYGAAPGNTAAGVMWRPLVESPACARRGGAGPGPGNRGAGARARYRS